MGNDVGKAMMETAENEKVPYPPSPSPSSSPSP